MRKIILVFLLLTYTATLFAQSKADSLAYQVQRKKINVMLAKRRLKFGQYSESLSQHSGIFGMQTKKDIRRSNDILMDIVKTDEEIFVQTKILLDYRTFVQKQVQSHSVETEGNNVGFMTAINKLRAENDKLKLVVDNTVAERQESAHIAMIIIVVLIVAVLLLLRAKFVKKD